MKNILKRYWIWLVSLLVIGATVSFVVYSEWQKVKKEQEEIKIYYATYYNDQKVHKRATSLYQAIEDYLIAHNGEYPKSRRDLQGYVDPNVKTPYCGDHLDGYIYECAFNPTAYGLIVNPIEMNITGRVTITKSKSMIWIEKHFKKEKSDEILELTDPLRLKKSRLLKAAQKCTQDVDCTVWQQRGYESDPCYSAINRHVDVTQLRDAIGQLQLRHYPPKCDTTKKLRAQCSENLCTIREKTDEDANVIEVGNKKYTYNDRGTLLKEETYKDGKLDGLTTSYSSLVFKTNETEYKKGKLHGKKKRFSTKGHVLGLSNYKNGVPDGIQKSFSSTNKLIQESLWRDGITLYVNKYFNETGALYHEYLLIDGRECNRYYNPDGTIRSEDPECNLDAADEIVRSKGDSVDYAIAKKTMEPYRCTFEQPSFMGEYSYYESIVKGENFITRDVTPVMGQDVNIETTPHYTRKDKYGYYWLKDQVNNGLETVSAVKFNYIKVQKAYLEMVEDTIKGNTKLDAYEKFPETFTLFLFYVPPASYSRCEQIKEAIIQIPDLDFKDITRDLLKIMENSQDTIEIKMMKMMAVFAPEKAAKEF